MCEQLVPQITRETNAQASLSSVLVPSILAQPGQRSNQHRAGQGSRRRRLWELDAICHCPVIGVCIPLAQLRRWVDKIAGARLGGDDYLVHVHAVSQCAQRTRLSESLQRDLELRYAHTVRRYKACKSTDEVLQAWEQDVVLGDVSGALWAALTHARCDDALQTRLCHDMHMLQHQAGARVQVDVQRLDRLASENAALVRELTRVQDRCTQALAQKATLAQHLQEQLLRAQTQLHSVQVQLARVQAKPPSMPLPGDAALARMQRRMEQLQGRQQALLVNNRRLRTRLRDAAMPAPGEPVHSCPRTEPMAAPVVVDLQSKTVLCVGGRSGNLASYRAVVERVGGCFSHHDGGLEDAVGALDASLASADMVICQTGCISHNAYWKVKDFCKRTGKRCVFVETPSASSLERCVAQLLQGKEHARR